MSRDIINYQITPTENFLFIAPTVELEEELIDSIIDDIEALSNKSPEYIHHCIKNN